MPDGAWLTVGGAVIGYAIKAGQDWWLATGKVKADREARAEARRDKRAERRDDLQRQALLNLQEVVGTASIKASKFGIVRTKKIAEGVAWNAIPVSDQDIQEFGEIRIKMTLITSRVIDDKLRERVAEYQQAEGKFFIAETKEEQVRLQSEISSLASSIIKRAGYLVRHLDEQE